MNQRRRCCIFRCVCMTPWIWQALCECQGSAVLTHRNLRTVEKPVGRGKCGRREKEAGRKQAGITFSCCPSILSVRWSSGPTALFQKHLCCCKEALLLLGSVGDAWSSWTFFFSFFSRPIHLSASWSWEHILCEKLSFREKSVLEEFSAYTHPCVWNCFTSVPSNT